MRLAAALATLAATVGFVPVLTAATRALTDVCVIDDPRATELSGLVATASGYVAVNDSQLDSNTVHILYLDAACKVTRAVRYPTPPRDPEDVAVAPDGAVWVADIGDNATAQSRRDTVALWSVPADGQPVIHRLTYPDGPHDAEALLFGGDGVPIIVTKEISGTAGIYRPGGTLQPGSGAGVAMTRVGEFKPQSTGENNLLGELGEVVITGAATSPDRKRIALRTYTAAYEWDVPDGDVVKAITTMTPRLTALPDEPQGEAIAYSADGASFLTISDEAGPTTIRAHTPSAAALQTPPPSLGPTSAGRATGLAAIPLWLSVAAALGGLALVGAGLLGVRRSRRVPVAD